MEISLIPGYEKYYLDKSGQVFSKWKKWNKPNPGEELHKLKSGRLRNGYLIVKLKCSDGKCRNKTIHSLMAETFIPNPDNKPQVNHKNGIKTDNRVENIEWATRSENQSHAAKIGLHNPSAGQRQATRSIKTENELVRIRNLIASGEQQKIIAKMFRVCPATIHNIKTGKMYAANYNPS